MTSASNNPTPDNKLPLGTLSASGTPPKARLANASQAAALFWQLHDAAIPRLDKARIIRGMFDGNPPYSTTKRRNQAEAWRPNFNTLEGASRLEAAKVPYYDLFSTASLYADCATDIDGDDPDAALDAASASRIRSEAFDRMLRSYRGFDTQFWTMLDDFVGFNKGFLWFPRPDSWHFKHLPWHRVYFPDGTSVDPDEWELFAIEHRWKAHRLWSFVSDEATAARTGWNRNQVIKAIRRAAPDDLRNRFDDPMEVQRQFRDNELYISARCGVIRAASIYVKEFDGTWSRMMVEVQDRNDAKDGEAPAPARSRIERDSGSDDDGDASGQLLGARDWLYNKQKIADELQQILVPFIFEAGDGAINELTGLGKKIISFCQAKDRLRNEQIANAMMRQTIVLQAQTGASQAKTGIINFGGGVCTLPTGYAIQPGTIFGDVEGVLGLNVDLDNTLDRNTGIYRPQFEKPQGNPESATAANIRFSQATVLSNSAVNRFYSQLDVFYDELYRRATLDLPATSRDKGIQAALKFQRECREAGLTEKQCRDRQPGSIRAQRAIGNGSPVMRQQQASALAQIVPYLGPRGLEEWKAMYVAAYGSQSVVNRLLPRADTAQVPTRDDWDASQENADMNQGNQPVFADWQNHQIHAVSHLTAATAAIASVTQGGADPGGPFTFLQVALPHIVQHISKVPREQIRKQLEAAYRQVAKGAQDVIAVAKQHAQQQGQMQQMSFDQQIKMMEAQHDAQLKDFKTQKQMEQREQKMRFDMQLAAQKAQQEGAIIDARTAHEIATGTARTTADIRNQAAKTQAQLEAQRAKAASKPTNE